MQIPGSGKLNIIIAVYGLKVVTDEVTRLIIDETPQTLNFKVTNYIIGQDGWRGQQKSLLVVYNYDGGDLHVATAKEGDVLTINPENFKKARPVFFEDPEEGDRLSILAASYGTDDVTYKIKKMISKYNTLSFTVSNATFGDSWYGVAKTLVIVLGYGHDVRAVEIFTEREACYIDLNDVVPAV